MSDIYDQLPDEPERPYLEWSAIPEDTEIVILIQSDPVPGPVSPAETHPDAVSDYSVLEMDAEVPRGVGDVSPGEYRLAVSSTRLARALGSIDAGDGDRIVVSWKSDGDYREYSVESR